MHMLWRQSGELIPQLQLFLSWSSPLQCFWELAFFPTDIDAESFEIESFLFFVVELSSLARSPEYYVRCENASWTHGDVGAASGVIFSHNDGIKLEP